MSWGRIKRLAREAGWILFGQVAAVIGALVLVRILTEHLSPEAYGQLALGLTLAGLVNQVVMGGVTAGIGRYYSIAAEVNDLSGYFRDSQRLMLLAASVVLVLGGLFLLGLLGLGHVRLAAFAGLIILFALLAGYGVAYGGILNAARQRALVAMHGGADAWLKILFSLGAIYWLGTSETAVVVGYVLSTLLVVVSQFCFVRRSFRYGEERRPRRQWGKQMWAYAWPFTTWGFFSWAQQSSDRWALEIFGSTDQVGLYAVLFQLGYTPLVMAMGMVMAFLGPILFQRAGDATDSQRSAGVRRLAWRITLACLAFTLVAFVLTLCLHEWFFSLLVSVEYRHVSYLMPWMVMAGGLFAAGQMLALRLMSDMQTSLMTSAKIWTALLGLVLNLYGASVAGERGVVFSLVFVSGVYLLWMLFLAKDYQLSEGK
ncbi:MAG: lipopolysaccharide biosynthesis protein [Burkholderiaceae bacterium]|jgi:O-antigen/teichoic acid export membrane protein|nr:lipopolysaccharide biosynthesis protein [Burkholderiaceae bacterium]